MKTLKSYKKLGHRVLYLQLCLFLIFASFLSFTYEAYGQELSGAKNIILMIADGWGERHIDAANQYGGSPPSYQTDANWRQHWMSTFAKGGDAYKVFNGKLDAMGSISYNSQDLELTFSGMDPSKIYTLVFYGHRHEYRWDRASRVTISDAADFTNQSSAADDNPRDDCGDGSGRIFCNPPNDESTRLPANNDKDYVARFTGIDPGIDGDVVLTISWDGISGLWPRGKYANAVMLMEESSFTAYNDLAWAPGQLNTNITTITSPYGGSGLASSGELVDFADGTGTGVTLTVTGGNFNGSSHATRYSGRPNGDYDPQKAWTDFDYVRQTYTDSAAAGTALFSGQKTQNRRIMVNADGSHRLFSTGELAKTKGKAVGAVSTVGVPDATPGAWTSHNDDRSNSFAIAEEGFFGDPKTTGEYPGGHGSTIPPAEVIIGGKGGVANSTIHKLRDESGQPGKHRLVERQAGQNGCSNLLNAANDPNVTMLAGLFDLNYHLADGSGFNHENSPLWCGTEAALTVLNRNPNGFELMVEGGAVDKASHLNDMNKMIGELIDFDQAVETVIDWVEDDTNGSSWENTLVIVTGDHECGYLTAGFGYDDNNNWGPLFPDELLCLVSDYTLGKEKPVSGSGGRRASWEDDGDNVIEEGETVYWVWHSGGHTNSLIPLYARGFGSDQFEDHATRNDPIRGAYLDNIDVFAVMNDSLVNPGLVAYYPFNGNADDESDNGNHGTVYGATPTEDRFGNSNSAYSFDGVNDYVRIPDSDSLDITGDLTVSAWIKTSDYRNIIFSNMLEVSPHDGYSLRLWSEWWNGDMDGKVRFMSGGNLWGNTPINLDSWIHVAVTLFGGTATSYVDGVKDSSETVNNPTANTVDQTIGASYTPYYFFEGVIDDVAIYNRALSEDEIQELSTHKPASGFTAYNDLAWAPGQLETNITAITSPNGRSVLPSSGELLNFADGTGTGVTLTVTGGDFNGSSHATIHSGFPDNGDAYDVFNGKLDAMGSISYKQPYPHVGDLVLTFSGMDPDKTYTLVFYGHRNDYGWDRASLVTISGDVGFTNQSSAAKGTDNPIFSGPTDPSTRLPADNENDYVTRFTGIDPGIDGEVVLIISWDGTPGSEDKGKYGNAVMLKEEP